MTRKHASSISAGVFSVVVAYAFFAGLWILLSDQAMWLLFSDQATLERVSMAKGWTFVAITTLLLYFLVRRLVGQLVAAHQRELAFEREREQPPPMLVAIANASSDAIFAKDSEGRYLLFNPAASRFVGKPEEEALGHDDRDLFPADQAEMLMAAGRRVMESGQTETSEEVLDTPEGMKVFLATKGPLRDELGRTFGIFGISRDITARKNAEALLYVSQERLRLLLDHAPAALAMFDREMRYLEVSRRWREDYFLGAGTSSATATTRYFPRFRTPGRRCTSARWPGRPSLPTRSVSRATTAPCSGCAGKCALGVDAMARSAASSSSVRTSPVAKAPTKNCCGATPNSNASPARQQSASCA